jgi:Predicted amidophosphoribosyltransferases
MYDDPVVKELVRVLKFERAKGAAVAMADAMLAMLGTFGEVCITHVPTANSRVRERGYDQAALIAKELSRRSGRLYAPLLARMGNQRQLGQNRSVRTKQMRGGFRILNPALLRDRHILLVDDVLTTGATCEAAARALCQAGAKRVSAIVFAVA